MEISSLISTSLSFRHFCCCNYSMPINPFSLSLSLSLPFYLSLTFNTILHPLQTRTWNENPLRMGRQNLMFRPLLFLKNTLYSFCLFIFLTHNLSFPLSLYLYHDLFEILYLLFAVPIHLPPTNNIEKSNNNLNNFIYFTYIHILLLLLLPWLWLLLCWLFVKTWKKNTFNWNIRKPILISNIHQFQCLVMS